MPPARSTLILCTCQQCIKITSVDRATGTQRSGQLLHPKTRKNHLMKDERQAIWARGADEQGPSAELDLSELGLWAKDKSPRDTDPTAEQSSITDQLSHALRNLSVQAPSSSDAQPPSPSDAQPSPSDAQPLQPSDSQPSQEVIRYDCCECTTGGF
ncbi:hypothetical protein MJO28_002498 [Puccinia striiformis f. sp. tritici]|uniref:Uncharacterized protein n=1 Tax=Puccinia striiformis f. sp. tritici TaxID=168172 RepID=A0ACC0EQ00_9BASI|nr:hypothetical protein MJO29_016545 [Puccinia striiformis f. sp. tritici]KAI7958707.1 hypothetical protein MJO28_002498 [Puccinia striiformis f. sp. tritici]